LVGDIPMVALATWGKEKTVEPKFHGKHDKCPQSDILQVLEDFLGPKNKTQLENSRGIPYIYIIYIYIYIICACISIFIYNTKVPISDGF